MKTTAKVKQNVKDSVNVIVNGASVNIESLFKAHKLTISVTGKSDDGKITLKSAGKAKVRLDGLNLTSQEGAPLTDKVTVPFSLRRSASLVGSPAFKIGNSYTVKTKGYEKTFTFNEPFTIVR